MTPADELRKALNESEKRAKAISIFEAHAYLRGVVRNVEAVLRDQELRARKGEQCNAEV